MSFEVLHGDCVEVMQEMPENSIDAASSASATTPGGASWHHAAVLAGLLVAQGNEEDPVWEWVEKVPADKVAEHIEKLRDGMDRPANVTNRSNERDDFTGADIEAAMEEAVDEETGG